MSHNSWGSRIKWGSTGPGTWTAPALVPLKWQQLLRFWVCLLSWPLMGGSQAFMFSYLAVRLIETLSAAFPLIREKHRQKKKIDFLKGKYIKWHIGWIPHNFMCHVFMYFWQLAAVPRVCPTSFISSCTHAHAGCENNTWADFQCVHTLQQKARVS